MEKKTVAINFVLSTIFHIAAFAFLAYVFAKSNPFPEIDKSVITVMLVSPPQQQATPPPPPPIQQQREKPPIPERPVEPDQFIQKQPEQEPSEIVEKTDFEELPESSQTDSGEQSEFFAEVSEQSQNTESVGYVPQTFEVQYTDAPRAIFMPQVPYPRAAKMANITGTAEIAYIIDETGRVRSVEILSMPDHPSFEASIRRTVMAWRFTPAKKDGKPVLIRATQTIVFELQD